MLECRLAFFFFENRMLDHSFPANSGLRLFRSAPLDSFLFPQAGNICWWFFSFLPSQKDQVDASFSVFLQWIPFMFLFAFFFCFEVLLASPLPSEGNNALLKRSFAPPQPSFPLSRRRTWPRLFSAASLFFPLFRDLERAIRSF